MKVRPILNRCVRSVGLRMMVLNSVGTFGASPTAKSNGCIELRETVLLELWVGVLLELWVGVLLRLSVGVDRGRLGSGRR